MYFKVKIENIAINQKYALNNFLTAYLQYIENGFIDKAS